MTQLDNAILELKAKREKLKGRAQVYLGLPENLRAPCQEAILRTGANTAYLLKNAIPAYLDDGIDVNTLQAWDKQDGVGNPIVTSIPSEMLTQCAEVSKREDVTLVAVLRAALGHLFGVSPDATELQEDT